MVFLSTPGCSSARGGEEGIPFDGIHHVGIAGALAAWRVTQGVYRFDWTVADAVTKTPLARDLPTQIAE